MNCHELMYLKAKLLCYGVQADKITKLYMKEINPYVLDKGFMHAAHFIIDDVIINTCISEEFCQNSPFSIKYNNQDLNLYENDSFVSKISVLPLPDWCNEYIDGYHIGDYIRPHSLNCVACWPYLLCNYDSKGNQCKFCSMGNYHIKTILPENVVGKMIGKSLEYNKEYEVALSGGTCHEPDHSIDYFSKVCESARKYNAEYISVETAPPNDLFYIEKLKESGATAIIMNLEVADDNLRKILCPGKSSITQIHYMHAYEKAVKTFGPGNVSCVLIAGIQKADDIINKSKELIEIGVIPTIIPFKPLDGCLMNSHKVTNVNELIVIANEVDNMMKKYNLEAAQQKGCTKCNGCSLEILASQM